ncbi:MAG: DUF4384 domain-containing protein [Thermoanaerobaculia bacterium]|nr:DUF4384 domain-containing protein [Thermoanaerobaculia bacterium]
MNAVHESLLLRYATGALSKEEERQLFQDALDDQNLFNELFVEDGLRRILDRPEFRRRIQLVLEREPATTSALWLLSRGWFLMAATLLLAATVALFFVSHRRQEETRGFSPFLSPARSIFSLELSNSEMVRLVLDRTGKEPVYRAGDVIRIGFRTEFDAHVALFEKDASGRIRRLYPAAADFGLVKKDQSVLIPPEGEPDSTVSGLPGPRHLRLVAVPASESPDLRDVRKLALQARRGAVGELVYVVSAP